MENNNSVAYIAKINSLTPIEGANKIELGKVEGWTSTIQKGIHKVGDMVLCITTDAVIPDNLAEKWGVASYLRKGNRVRTVKLRGVYSECILIPLSDIGERKGGHNEGDDLMEWLGIFKYEPPAVIIHLPGGKQRKQKQNPNFSIYYKFPNLKNVPHMFNEDDDVVITRKIHGSNARYGITRKPKLSIIDKIRKFFGNHYIDFEFVAGSHNVQLTDEHTGFYGYNIWKEVAEYHNIEQKLWDYAKPLIDSNSLKTGFIVYGEVYGKGVQGENYVYGLEHKDLVIFDMEYDGTYLDRRLFEKLATFYVQLPMVEKLYEGKWSQEIQDKFTLGQYVGTTKVPHEGIVISHVSGDRHKVAKVINPEYHTFAEKNQVPDSH